MRNQFTFFIALIKQLGIVLLCFSICRVLFYLFNNDFFINPGLTTFLYGIRFDITAIVYIFSPFIFLQIIPFSFRKNKGYQIFTKIIFHIILSVALLLNCIDFEYFKFTLKRTTADFFSLFSLGNDIPTLLPQYIIDFWHVPLIWIILIVFSEFLYRKTQISPIYSVKTRFLPQFLIFIFTIILWIIGARGGLQLKPINIITAGQHVEACNIPVVLNTPFTIIKTLQEENITEKNYFLPQEIKKYFNPIKTNKDTPLLAEQNFNPLNVVIIIMESFSKEYIGSLNPHTRNGNGGYTPFLDSLIQHSLTFTNAFANAKSSITAIPAITSGLPALMNAPYITSRYSSNEIYSIANILKQKGYYTAFYHGGTNGTMGFDAYANVAGFDNYFGRFEYNKNNPNHTDYDGNWGIYDEPFFQYFAKNLQKTSQPFFCVIFSLSSHHPYHVPEKYKNIFPKGEAPIHESIGYADYSLKKFFEISSKMKWFDNTLFVITADHTSASFTDFYNNSVGSFAIPIIFYKKDIYDPSAKDLITTGKYPLKGIDSTITQQTDIMPSILDYLHYTGKYIAFGSSVFDKEAPHFCVNYFNNIYQLIENDHVLQFDGNTSIALYNFKQDSLLKENILEKNPTIAKKMESRLKAIIQEYNHRLIHNELWIREEI